MGVECKNAFCMIWPLDHCKTSFFSFLKKLKVKWRPQACFYCLKMDTRTVWGKRLIFGIFSIVSVNTTICIVEKMKS